MARTFAPTLRSTKGSKLTIAEGDANNTGISGIANAANRTFMAASETAMLTIADTPIAGDSAWRTDENKYYTYIGGGAGTLTNWKLTGGGGSKRLFAASINGTMTGLTETSFVGTTGYGSRTLPASIWGGNSPTIRIKASGVITSGDAVTQMSWQLYLGSTVIAGKSPSLAFGWVGTTHFTLTLDLTPRTVSASGVLACTSTWVFDPNGEIKNINASTASASANLTVDQFVDLKSWFNLSGGSITTYDFIIEKIDA